jgi:hypothetical protein
MGWKNDIRGNNHISDIFKEIVLTLTLQYFEASLSICGLKVDLYDRNSKFMTS